METRLKKFNLEVAPEKTKLFEFGLLLNLKQKPEEKDQQHSTF